MGLLPAFLSSRVRRKVCPSGRSQGVLKGKGINEESSELAEVGGGLVGGLETMRATLLRAPCISACCMDYWVAVLHG